MGEETPRGQSRTGNVDTSGGSGWITTEVAAKAVRVSPRTIRRYIERGQLDAKPQGEGVRREWLVSVDSLHALRATRATGEGVHDSDREMEAADNIADVVREMAARLETRVEEATELRVRLELTERAESTLREVLEDERRRREQAERRAEELERRLEVAEAAETGEDAAHGDGLVQEGQEDTTTTPGGDTRPVERSWWRRMFGG